MDRPDDAPVAACARGWAAATLVAFVVTGYVVALGPHGFPLGIYHGIVAILTYLSVAAAVLTVFLALRCV
jgi:hypothetical protein